MLFRAAFAFALACASSAAAPHDRVRVEPVKTSIYVGSVTLTPTEFVREGGEYAADYRAKVFPYFFYNERGRLRIAFSDDALARLARGETVAFEGQAENTDGEPRRVTGRAVPADARTGKIKVRVLVSPKIELIFNSTYRFSGE
jgi:hypothetical protein